LKIKNEEVEHQGKQIKLLQKEAEEGKALQENLTRMTTILSERDRELSLCQEQVRMLEKQKEMHKSTLNQVIKDITEEKEKTECHQEHIQEMEKQQEKQRIALSKMSQEELEERNEDIRSKQELIGELEKQLELQSTAVSKMIKELEERDLVIKLQEEKIMILEQHGASQVRNVFVDLDHLKGNLKEKNLELMSLTQQVQELKKEREEVKSLHTSLEHLRAVLKNSESECGTQREELRLLQQHKEQQEGHLQELLDKAEKLVLSLSQKDEELESQEKQIQEVKGVMEMHLRTVQDQLEQTLETIKEKDRLIDIQKQQTRSYKEKIEKQVTVLHRDLEYTRTILKEKDLMIEYQKELIETFQKQNQDSEQQEEVLQHLQMALKEKEQEMLSLRKQCEACKEKEEKLVQTKAMLQKLECTESSLEARDQEIASLQEHVQDLREQKEAEGKKVKCLEQDLATMSQMMQEKHLEFLKQTEQMNMFQIREESMKVALASCQKQVTLLEEVVRNKDEDHETLMQKLQCQEEQLQILQNLQLRLTEKNEEVRRDGQQETVLEGEGETKAQSKQKEREQELRRQSELLKGLTSALPWKDEGETLKKQIQKPQQWEEEEVERRKALQERDLLLERQKELTQQREAEKEATGEELEHVVAVLKQTESRELKWREKAQVLRAALTETEVAKGNLSKEIAILQGEVTERGTDQSHQQ
ncbi:Centrosome-associated protein CEP250, partial [Acanthisitta chloris]